LFLLQSSDALYLVAAEKEIVQFACHSMWERFK